MSRPSDNPGAGLEALVLARIDRDEVQVPPYPTVALKLQAVVREKDFGIADLLKHVSSDAALAANVLKLANSALYSRGGISSLPQALGMIGSVEVVRLALVEGLSGFSESAGSLLSLRRKLWQDGVASAVICQLLARKRGLSEDEAFIGGLLHDFGWLIGLGALEQALIEHPTVAPRSAGQWSIMLNRWHVRLGQALATKWKLPALLHEVIAHHHSPAQASPAHAALVELVALGDAVLGQLSTHAGLTADDLVQETGVSEAEAVALARALPEMPGFITAFGPPTSATSAEPAPSRLVSPGPLVPAGFRALSVAVMQVSPRKRGPYGVTAIGTSSCLLTGKEPLPVNQLIEVELQLQGRPLRLWARTVECREESGAFLLECKPFALNGEALKQWNDLYRNAPKPAAAP
jgi:HD-like signal output (HDOD) protein